MLARFKDTFSRYGNVLFSWFVRALVLLAIVAALTGLAFAICFRSWDAAATLLAGFLAVGVVWWQGSLIKRQLAFSTFIELDKEWNSEEMVETRKNVRDPQDQRDISRLEGALEFFEKMASFWLTGVLDTDLVCNSTLGWYAAHYYLFAREHGKIEHLRGPDVWNDYVYGDLERLYKKYLTREAGHQDNQRAWEADRMKTENTFWEQERKD